MDEVIKPRAFGELDINDNFFDSLKESYSEFENWFQRKKDESAYVTYDEAGKIIGFLYLKREEGSIKDIDPPLNSKNALKIGTFKINPHRTRLGNRYMKKIFDTALVYGLKNIYVTVFEQHEGLIKLFEKYGFNKYGTKTTGNGVELVYHKNLDIVVGDPTLDYPIMDLRKSSVWLLSIEPKWHTRLFPDSILKTEDSGSIIKDVSYTNSILKVYISWAFDIKNLKKGDGIVIYRTAEDGKSAKYSSVVTSLCMVVDTKLVSDFKDVDEFVKKLLPYSVFTEEDLRGFYSNNRRNNMVAIKMLYNVALPKRPIRKKLIEENVISEDERPTFLKLDKDKLNKLLAIGEVYEGIVIN